MGYPTAEQEIEVLRRAENRQPIQEIEAVMSVEELLTLQQHVKQVYVEDGVKSYIVDIARATRNHSNVYLGVSPRASIALMKAAQAYAFMQNRDFVKPDDIKYLAPFVFSHRLILAPEARYEGVQPEKVIQEVIQQIFVPVKRFADS